MLPDLVTMVGARVPDELPHRIADGCRAHHRVDGRFHDAALFRGGVARLLRQLRERGLARGTSRGAAHVGYELLVDRALPWDDSLASAVRDAFEGGRRIADRFDRDRPGRWEALMDRFSVVDLEPGTSTLDQLARRVEVVLDRRPRLAMAAGDVDQLRSVLELEAGAVAVEAPVLLDVVARP
jgi:hypothetical protein